MRLMIRFWLLTTLIPCFLCGNLYDDLGVGKKDSMNAIKKAYRKLAKKWHPDKNKEPGAAEKFARINKAYECLSDSDKRKSYDVDEDVKACDGASNHPFGGFGDVFASMFGGAPHQQREEDHRGSDILVDFPVTLQELYTGETIEMMWSRPIKKSKPGARECKCRMEMKTQNLGAGRFQMVQHRVCSECDDFQYVTEDRRLELDIEPGMLDGYSISFHGEGEPHEDGESGDLKLTLRQHPHPIFHRIKDDLFTNISISLTDALVGFDLKITHLDGHEVRLKQTQITWPGAIMRVANEGMPYYEDDDKKGVLVVTFDVVFPRGRTLSDSEAVTIQSIFDKGDQVREKTVNYGVSSEPVAALSEGRISPIVYNGFLSESVANKYLVNIL